jgi:hypothetical protein
MHPLIYTVRGVAMLVHTVRSLGGRDPTLRRGRYQIDDGFASRRRIGLARCCVSFRSHGTGLWRGNVALTWFQPSQTAIYITLATNTVSRKSRSEKGVVVYQLHNLGK